MSLQEGLHMGDLHSHTGGWEGGNPYCQGVKGCTMPERGIQLQKDIWKFVGVY